MGVYFLDAHKMDLNKKVLKQLLVSCIQTFTIDNAFWEISKCSAWYLLQALFGFIVIHGICSKSIQNVTIDDSKFVTTDMLENWKKNMTDWITDALDRKFSSWCFFSDNFVIVKSGPLEFGRSLVLERQ